MIIQIGKIKRIFIIVLLGVPASYIVLTLISVLILIFPNDYFMESSKPRYFSSFNEDCEIEFKFDDMGIDAYFVGLYFKAIDEQNRSYSPFQFECTIEIQQGKHITKKIYSDDIRPGFIASYQRLFIIPSLTAMPTFFNDIKITVKDIHVDKEIAKYYKYFCVVIRNHASFGI